MGSATIITADGGEARIYGKTAASRQTKVQTFAHGRKRCSAQLSDIFREFCLIHGNNLPYIDYTGYWKIGLTFPQMQITRGFRSVQIRGNQANHTGRNGALVENIILHDYARMPFRWSRTG